MPDRSIKRKLRNAIITACVTVLLVAGTGFVTYEVITFRRSLVNYVTTVGEIIAANSSGALSFENEGDAAEVLASLAAEKYIVNAALYDRENQLFAHYPSSEPVRTFPRSPGKDGQIITNGVLICVTPVIQNHSRQGTLYMTATLAPMYERLQLYAVIALLLLLASLGLALMVSKSVQQKITGPILDLARIARTISDKRDYTVRAQKTTRDEIGTLTEAFNHMLSQIQERDAALRENSDRLNLALEASRTGTWDWKIPEDRITWDQYLEGLLGGVRGTTPRTFSEFLGLLKPEERMRVEDLAREAIDFRREFVADFRVTWPDGETRHLSSRGHAFYDADGKPTRMTGVMIDITDAERAEQALRESEQRYRSLVSALTSVVWVSDPDGAFVTPQVSWERYTGQTFKEYKGFGWIEAMHPDDRKRLMEEWNTAFQTANRIETGGRIWNAETKSYRHFLVRAVPIRNADATIREWVGTVTDVNDRKVAEEEIHRLNAELEQRVLERTAELANTNQELEAFTYSVSHDLRSPLRHIDAYAQILQEEFAPELPEVGKGYLNRIRNGTQNMGHLVDDLLNLARVGRTELTFQPANLKEIVEEVIEDLSSETEKRKIEWHIGDLPSVECDRGLIKQVFANLVSNAVKYSRPREVAKIEIDLTTARGQRAIYVRDNGVGFNMKYANKLFGVFQRLHKAEEFEGTGVGLATVERIVRKHGGEIWVEAEPDKGATFYFTMRSLQGAEVAKGTRQKT